MIRVNASFCHWCLGNKQKQCAMQVRNLSGEMTCSPVSCSSCLLSHLLSSFLSHVYCLQSSLFYFICLLSPISFSRLPSHISSELGWHVCVAFFAPASHLWCLHCVFRDRITSFASFAHPNAFCWRNGGRHNSPQKEVNVKDANDVKTGRGRKRCDTEANFCNSYRKAIYRRQLQRTSHSLECELRNTKEKKRQKGVGASSQNRGAKNNISMALK